ncbi:MAG: DUF2087 domain-containing protein [Faecalibacterium sp.]|nr:DUF2087 domain-containing protein [Faecalibacterium sp.]
MDAEKIGALLHTLRTGAGYTQRQVAQALCVTEQAVSKWERGKGCPDLSLLPALADLYAVDLRALLAGQLKVSSQGGNMRNLKIYFCPQCGNLAAQLGGAQLTCCGRPLAALQPRPAADGHLPTITAVEDEWYLEFDHPMTKQHHLTFVAQVGLDHYRLTRLYPEQQPALRLPKLARCTLLIGCSEGGLYKVVLNAAGVPQLPPVTVTEAERAAICRALIESESPLRLRSYSYKAKKRQVLLDRIAAELQPEYHYPEPELNAILKQIWPDAALLRRELVDFGYLHRTPDCKTYWKA